MPPGSFVVLTNREEDCSPEAFRALLADPEPDLVSIGAAEALQELRDDGGVNRPSSLSSNP